MNRHAVVLAIVVLPILAGCSARVSGEPAPATNSERPTSETSPSTDPKFADLLPPRPRELDLTDVDPCADLLTEQQLLELDYDLGYNRPPRPSQSIIHGGPECTFASNGGTGRPGRNIGSVVGISTTEGALAWVTDPARPLDTRPEVVDVQGFAALVLPHPELTTNCLVVVDTADGQYLEVSTTADDGTAASVEPFCVEATRVADMALQTIAASR